MLLQSRDTTGLTVFITDCCAHQNDIRPNLLPLTSELQRPAAATNQWTETGTGVPAHWCGDIQREDLYLRQRNDINAGIWGEIVKSIHFKIIPMMDFRRWSLAAVE